MGECSAGYLAVACSVGSLVVVCSVGSMLCTMNNKPRASTIFLAVALVSIVALDLMGHL